MSVKPIELPFGAQTFGLDALSAKLIDLKRGDNSRAAAAIAAGQQLLASPTSAKLADKFSQLVCKWGRGDRVYANLRRHHGPHFGRTMAKALHQAASADDDEGAIAPLIEIKGLSTSFASKHLRLLDPTLYGTLDSRLRDGLGFALNAPGYAFFMRELRAFASVLREVAPSMMKNVPIAMLEQSIFEIVRARATRKHENI